jgi:hypothetical protein
MNEFFVLAPDTYYGLEPLTTDKLVESAHLLFPVIALPHYIARMLRLAARLGGIGASNRAMIQIEFLVDGMDLDNT